MTGYLKLVFSFLFIATLIEGQAQSASLKAAFDRLDVSWKEKGYSRPYKVVYSGMYDDDDSKEHSISLEAGKKYFFVVMSSGACDDIDAYVYDPYDDEIASENNENSSFSLPVEPTRSGRHTIELAVHDCSDGYTEYGLAIFTKGTSQNSGQLLACGYNDVQLVNVTSSGVHSFTNVGQAEQFAKSILSKVGLQSNFVIQESREVANAAAVIDKDKRLILYNPNFIREMRQRTGSDWAAMSIMAHEIGHHLNGHTLGREGSMPPKEIEADIFSGTALAKLGATLDEATQAIRLIASEQGSSTHPPKGDRVSAITKGWNAGRSGTTPNPVNPNPVITGSSPVAQCTFQNDVNQYFVMSDNTIVAKVTTTGQLVQVGYIEASNDPRFRFIYVVPQIRYGIDTNGYIWTSGYMGQLVVIGRMVSLR